MLEVANFGSLEHPNEFQARNVVQQDTNIYTSIIMYNETIWTLFAAGPLTIMCTKLVGKGVWRVLASFSPPIRQWPGPFGARPASLFCHFRQSSSQNIHG